MPNSRQSALLSSRSARLRGNALILILKGIKMPKKGRPQTVASSLGTAALGLALLIVGTAMKSHFELKAAICNTYGGPTSGCVADSTGFTIGQVMQPIGGILIGIGVIVCVLLLISGHNTATSPSAQRAPGNLQIQPGRNASAKIPDTSNSAIPGAGPEPQAPVNRTYDW